MRRDEQGAGTLLVVLALQVAVLLGAAIAVVGGYALAAHHARLAADLSAISAAGVRRGGADPCPAAATIAHRHRARILQCTLTGDQLEFVVSLQVAVPVEWAPPGLPEEVTARAFAGSVDVGIDQSG